MKKYVLLYAKILNFALIKPLKLSPPDAEFNKMKKRKHFSSPTPEADISSKNSHLLSTICS